jgi:hypothetical protein
MIYSPNILSVMTSICIGSSFCMRLRYLYQICILSYCNFIDAPTPGDHQDAERHGPLHLEHWRVPAPVRHRHFHGNIYLSLMTTLS